MLTGTEQARTHKQSGLFWYTVKGQNQQINQRKENLTSRDQADQESGRECWKAQCDARDNDMSVSKQEQ